MTDRDLMQQALEAQQPVAEVKLMVTGGNAGIATRIVEIDDPLRDRLHPGTKLYTAPQPRQWQGLTEEEIVAIVREAAHGAATRRGGTTSQRIARAIEAKLREKNA